MKNETLVEIVRNSKLMNRGQHIVLGLSGGPDSVCLFHVLKSLEEALSLTLHPVHVNHQIRKVGAEEDQAYVEELCRASETPCHVEVIDCVKRAKEQGVTTEEAGRDARYEAFRNYANQLVEQGIPKEAIVIALAHHADDQAETILFRLLRGTGTDGLAGMLPLREDASGYKVIRPLLTISKQDILEYCQRNELSPRQDHTNEEPIYARNRLRLELLPLLEGYNPEIRDALLRLGQTAAEDRKALEHMAAAALQEDLVQEETNEIVLKRSHRYLAILHREYALALRRLGLSKDLERSHYQLMDEVAQSRSPSAAGDLPHGYRILRRYEQLVFQKPLPQDVEEAPAFSMRMRILSRADYELQKESLQQGTFAAFDAEALDAEQLPISVRARVPGDYLVLSGGKHKKLQNFFVDEKIGKEYREHILFLARGNEVLFLPKQHPAIVRARYTANYPLLEETKKVFLIEVIGKS